MPRAIRWSLVMSGFTVGLVLGIIAGASLPPSQHQPHYILAADQPSGTWTWLKDSSAQLQSLSSIAQIVGLVLVITGIVGIFLTYSQLRVAADQVTKAVNQTQVATLQDTARASRELFMRMSGDSDLRTIFDPKVTSTDQRKVDEFIGVLINHFATIHMQWKLDAIPRGYWTMVERDAKGFFGLQKVKTRWQRLRDFYLEDFRAFVENLEHSEEKNGGRG